MHSYEIFQHYEKSKWRLSDLDFASIDMSLVHPEYVRLARSAAMGESNVIAAVHGFLNEFLDDYDFSTFAVIWGNEEVQHHVAFHSWVTAVGEKTDANAVAAMREPYAPGTTPSATLATNIISELTVNHIYRAVAGWVEEPVLRTILLNASRDEAGHAREFIRFATRRLEAHPEELGSMLETLYIYTSDSRIKHPVGIFKGELDQLADHDTIDTGFDLFLEKVAGEGDLDILQAKIRRTFGTITGKELDSNARVRRALAECLT